MDIRYFGQSARLSEAVVAGGFVFLSGMVPENTEADVKGQTQNVLRKSTAGLKNAVRTRRTSSKPPFSSPIWTVTPR